MKNEEYEDGVYPEDMSATRKVCVLGHAMKETLTATLARKALELGVRIGGGEVAASHCISDGGDGFLDAFSQVRPGRIQRAVTTDALGKLVVSDFYFDDANEVAAVEMALISGMAMIPREKRDLMRSGTMGLGTVVLRALELGAREVHLGLGGSATCDGGVGMLMELSRGLHNSTLPHDNVCAGDLEQNPHIDIKALRRSLADVRLVAYCDVQNPLLGEIGTARVYAGQKGANPREIEELDAWLARWARGIEEDLGEDISRLPGAGAAGGVGFAVAALGGELHDGGTRFCDLVGLDRDLRVCDLMVTCEGRFDHSSFHGKAPWKAASRAVERGRDALIACGISDESAREKAADLGVHVLEIAPMLPQERRIAEAFTLLQQGVSYFIRTGRTDAPPPLASGDRIEKL